MKNQESRLPLFIHHVMKGGFTNVDAGDLSQRTEAFNFYFREQKSAAERERILCKIKGLLECSSLQNRCLQNIITHSIENCIAMIIILLITNRT